MSVDDSASFDIRDKIGSDFIAGGEILPLTVESQERIRRRLVACEGRLNTLFGDVIEDDRQAITGQVRFMATLEFFEKAIVGERELPKDLRSLADLITTTFETLGLRSFDGKTVMVHTTVYDRKDKPRLATEEESFSTGRHEMVHGKIQPVCSQKADGVEERRTGCKVVTLSNGKVVDVAHGVTYEAQTDALAVVSSHPEARSWSDVFHLYIQERIGEGDDYGFGMSALTRLMDFAFPDFQKGLLFLGRSYFTCDSEGFFGGLKQGVAARGVSVVENSTFSKLVGHSKANVARGMTETVTQMINQFDTRP